MLATANPGLDPWAHLREHLLDACALLSIRVSAVGLSDALRARSPRAPPSDSPFFRLPRVVDGLAEAVRLGGDVLARATECRAVIADCRRVSATVGENLERYGVSVDVVYRLELVGKTLDRLALLLRQLEPSSELERAIAAKALLAELVGLRLRDRQLGDILAVALRARQVDRSDRFRLLMSVLATYLRSPLQFFLPPSRQSAPRVHGPVSVPPPVLR